MGGNAADAGPVRISMLSPNRERCGISDYSRNLIAALGELSSVELVRCLEPPGSSASQSHMHALSSRSSRAGLFHKVGSSLSATPVQLAHVQHEYSLFGGVAPHRNQAAALYSSMTVPVVITVHEIVSEIGGAVHRTAIRHVNRSNFLHPAIRAWIVHTDADRERLAAIGVNREAIHVAQMGVPTMQLQVERGTARARLGLTDKRVVTLFGFLSAKKGHMDAVEAISKLSDEFVLVLAGDRHPDDRTDYVPRLMSEIERRNMSNRVRIMGYLPEDELKYVMAATEVAVAPYHHSSGSASVAHLLAAGIPVIASDISVFREMEAEMPGTVALVPPHRTDLLARELLRVMKSPEVLRSLRCSAARYASTHTYRTMAETTVKVYQTVLA